MRMTPFCPKSSQNLNFCWWRGTRWSIYNLFSLSQPCTRRSSCYYLTISTLPLDIRRQAKELIENGKTSAEVGALLDIKPGTIREWKRRYMWDGPEGLDRPCNEDLDHDQVPAEYERVMSLDVMDTLDWIRRMPMPRRIDAILKRERALGLLSKRAERVIGGFGRQLGQQNKVIQVNAITQVLKTQLTPDSV